MKIKILFLFALLAPTVCIGQLRMIKGKVVGIEHEQFRLLDLVTVYNFAWNVVGNSNAIGEFTVFIPEEETELRLVRNSMELTRIVIPANCNTIEVYMIPVYPFSPTSLLQKVNDERQRLFNSLPIMHKRLFGVGIFKEEKPRFQYLFTTY